VVAILLVEPHVNQPGGPYRASAHPAAAGRERELRRLADAVRRLAAATVEHVAGPEETDALAADVEALAARLEARVPDPLPPRYLHPDQFPFDDRHAHDGSQFDYVIGLYNPVALPVQMSLEDGRAVGQAVFTTPYEGPPGCVHGAVLAACFDQVFVLAAMASGQGGPTVRLELDFRRPTPLRRPVTFEAWVTAVDGRKIRTEGRVLFEGEVCVEARGTFVALDREGVERLRDR
jgi:acyl-coenzyme A thioesterase PaaI-like protein